MARRPLQVVAPAAATYRWVTWSGDGFVPFELPEVGQTVTIPPIDLRDILFGKPG